jgi:thioredoxin 1
VNANVKVLTTDNFDQEVLQSAEPVLVDFWATWCPPCRLIAPTIEALADEYQGRVKVAKLDVDEHGELAGRYGVRSIPTLLLFKGGEVVEQRVGALPRPELVRLLDQHVEARASA